MFCRLVVRLTRYDVTVPETGVPGYWPIIFDIYILLHGNKIQESLPSLSLSFSLSLYLSSLETLTHSPKP